MPDLPISSLPPATFVKMLDLFAIVQDGVTKNAQKLMVFSAAPGEAIGLTGAGGALVGIDNVGNIFISAGAGKSITFTPAISPTLSIGLPIVGSTPDFILNVDALGQLGQVQYVPSIAGGFGTDSSVALLGQVPVADGAGGWTFSSVGPLSIGNAILLSSPGFVLVVDSLGNLGQEQYLAPVRGGLGTDASVALIGQVPTADGTGGFTFATPSGGIAIGNPVGSGIANCLLFIDGAGDLACNANLTFTTTTGVNVTQGVFVAELCNGTVAVYANYPGFTAALCDGAEAGQFQSTGFVVALCSTTYAFRASDGTHTVTICDGVNNVLYSPGAPGNWAGTPPTDLWVAIDRLLAWLLTQAAITGNP